MVTELLAGHSQNETITFGYLFADSHSLTLSTASYDNTSWPLRPLGLNFKLKQPSYVLQDIFSTSLRAIDFEIVIRIYFFDLLYVQKIILGVIFNM